MVFLVEVIFIVVNLVIGTPINGFMAVKIDLKVVKKPYELLKLIVGFTVFVTLHFCFNFFTVVKAFKNGMLTGKNTQFTTVNLCKSTKFCKTGDTVK
jgi:hypothetical protein